MCGIIGWVGKNPDLGIARKMLGMLNHRGPDDFGEWSDAEQAVWFGHRRLSVLDLSPAGHQPMVSRSGRFVLTFNGEVYNHKQLRDTLSKLGFRFRGHSDTEVLLAAIEAWGLEKATKEFVGMFAFGLYDRIESCLWLVRDRLGIKPLYYVERDGELAFASELSPLCWLPWLKFEINPDALGAYFRYLCVPAPATIVRGALKLKPGHLLRWDPHGSKISCYWDLRRVVEEGLENPVQCSFLEAAEDLERRLQDAVGLRMEADVPLGAFLSGGVDSSLIAALMQSQSTKPVLTFSIGFSEPSHDESPYARAVASHLGTNHYEHILCAHEIPDLFPLIINIHDEPFADGSSVPTYLLNRFAREHVTVALSGDGGDELFGGYPRYFWASRIQQLRRMLTPKLAHGVGSVLQALPAAMWDGLITRLGGERLAGNDGLAKRVQRLAGYLSCEPERVYEEMGSAWRDPAILIGQTPQQNLGPDVRHFPNMCWAEQMMATDQANYLVDDILTKVDRASMAVSLEARVPLLDHRLVEWSWRVPLAYKLASRGDRGKLLLREVLYRYVPRELIERPKAGLTMPIGRWLRNELRQWAEDLLSASAINSSGLLDAKVVRKVWSEHLSGTDRLPQIWTVLMFQQWHEKWRYWQRCSTMTGLDHVVH